MIRDRIRRDIRNYLPAAAVVAAVWIGFTLVFGAVCPSVLVFGLPCPGCGMSRAAVCLLTGRWQEAMQYNPMAVFWVAAILVFFYFRYVKGSLPGRKPKRFWGAVTLLVLVTVAVYALRMYLYFPGEKPLVYTSGNLLERCLPGYENLLKRIAEKR